MCCACMCDQSIEMYNNYLNFLLIQQVLAKHMLCGSWERRGFPKHADMEVNTQTLEVLY